MAHIVEGAHFIGGTAYCFKEQEEEPLPGGEHHDWNVEGLPPGHALAITAYPTLTEENVDFRLTVKEITIQVGNGFTRVRFIVQNVGGDTIDGYKVVIGAIGCDD